MDDIEHRPPYLWVKDNIKNINKDWQNRVHNLKEFATQPNVFLELTDEGLPYIPETYYDPHLNLPAFRNHEQLLTIDPQNVKYTKKGDNIESEKQMMLKNGLKPHKKQQNHVGVAYTPDFDFDLWNEDPNRPHSLINTYNLLEKDEPKIHEIKRKQLEQRKPFLDKSYVPLGEKLIEFQWKSRQCRNQYKPNRAPNFTVVKIIGNGRGCAGIGFGRGKSFQMAAKKAEHLAKTNMVYLPRYLNHTISCSLYGRYHRLFCVIEPKPFGYGERGPPVIKAICHAFGVRDYLARMYRKNRFRKCRQGPKFIYIRAIWRAFLRATNPELDCQNRGTKMIETFPERDGINYQLQRGYGHDQYIQAKKILNDYQVMYENDEGFSQYDINDQERLSLPLWITDEPNAFWEGGMPDISEYKWRPDLIDILQQKGPAGISTEKEKQIQRLLSEKVDPCDHHFRWMTGMIQITPNKTLGM